MTFRQAINLGKCAILGGLITGYSVVGVVAEFCRSTQKGPIPPYLLAFIPVLTLIAAFVTRFGFSCPKCKRCLGGMNNELFYLSRRSRYCFFCGMDLDTPRKSVRDM